MPEQGGPGVALELFLFTLLQRVNVGCPKSAPTHRSVSISDIAQVLEPSFSHPLSAPANSGVPLRRSGSSDPNKIGIILGYQGVVVAILFNLFLWVRMWNFASNFTVGNTRPKESHQNHTHDADCSDDEGSSVTSREDRLECPICWESFNIVENIPYVLWCGHTLCKNCILGLQWAVVKCPSLPIQLPLFISCPWCNLLSLRLVYRGNLKFPRKNFFLLWMLESMNGDRRVSRSASCDDDPPSWPPVRTSSGNSAIEPSFRRASQADLSEPVQSRRDQSHPDGFLALERLHSSIRKSLVFFIHVTAKFPLVIIFLLILLYAIPASAAILALYMLITIVFALPSVLILYFAYPSLDWLVREIMT